MLFTKLNLRDKIIKEELKKIKKNNIKLIKKQKLISNGHLQIKDFEFNLYNEKNVIKQIIKKLNNLNEMSVSHKYENLIIYQIKIIKIEFKGNDIIYLKYKKINKSENLLYSIINNINIEKIKKIKKNLKKIIYCRNNFKLFLSNVNSEDNNDNKFNYNLKFFLELKKNKEILKKLMENLKIKNNDLKKINYSIFREILEKRKCIMDKENLKEKLEIKIDFYNNKKLKKIANLKNKEELLNGKNYEFRNIKKEFCNFKTKNCI